MRLYFVTADRIEAGSGRLVGVLCGSLNNLVCGNAINYAA